ncbi:hypothetical protein N0V82_009504 [Gnomoniopsis sp. IMI 355080]|nr:hypothetical protein N0V82_009504 [Gnomoniopsis sp. IMI 355080]
MLVTYFDPNISSPNSSPSYAFELVDDSEAPLAPTSPSAVGITFVAGEHPANGGEDNSFMWLDTASPVSSLRSFHSSLMAGYGLNTVLSSPPAPRESAEVVDTPWPAEMPDSVDDRHRWFERVFIPAMEAQYRARTNGADTVALGAWLGTVVRPLVQQVLLAERLPVQLMRIVNL